MNLSRRAARVWARLEQIFGPALNAAYPLGMSEGMAQVVDRAEDEAVKDALMRIKAMRRPPSVIEFQALMEGTPQTQSKPNIMPALVAYATKNLSLSENQLKAPWTWLYEGHPFPGSMFFAIRGVRIPADEKEGRGEIVLTAEVLS